MKKISDILRKKQVLYPLIAFAGFILGGAFVQSFLFIGNYRRDTV